MRANGNADKRICAGNLLAIARGEVPYDRLRGLDVRPIDKPAKEAIAEIQQDAHWMLGIYEPRAEVDDVQVSMESGTGGAFSVSASIS